MSYVSIKLGQSPLLYYRLDVGGFGVDGELIPDLGSAGLDATLSFTGSNPAWGWPSPIETDPPSREFWGYTNAGIFGFTGNSYIERASDPSMQPSPKDFTVGGWLRPMADIPAAGDFAMFDKRSTGGVLLTFALGTRIGGFCFDSAGTLYKVIDFSLLVTDHLGESFYVVVVRSGDALVLYVNGTLRGITTVTSGLPTQFNSNPFRIQPLTGFYTNARHDEVEYHTRALSQVEIVASYEAALNALNMRGEANIRTTAVLNGLDEPDPIAYPFRHNWEQPVVERLSWRTSLFRPTNGSTELRRQRSAPRRSVEYQHLLYSEDLRRRFEARAFAGQTQLVQFEPDKVRVSDLLLGTASAVFDTRYRDFEVGQYVLVYESDDHYEHQLITAITDDGIELDPLEQSYTRPWLKPARIARLPNESEMDAVTDVYGDASTIYEYLEEDEPLNPRRITTFSPTLTYRSREVFDLSQWQGHDYSEIPVIQWAGDRERLDYGTGVISTKSYRWGAEQLQPYNMNLEGRELIAQYLGWLYERAGQSNPFWMPTFRQDLRPLSINVANNRLLVSGHEYTKLYAAADNRIDLAFVYFDNSYQLRRIESSRPVGPDDELTLTSTPPTLTNLRWLCFLRRVILSSDDVEIAWHTDDTARVAFAVVDAPLDWTAGSPSISPSPSASISTSPSPSRSGSTSVSPSASASPSFSISPSLSPSASQSISPSGSSSPSSSESPSSSVSPSSSISPSVSPSSSTSPSV
jgi:hypothetical protein